jgi:zinc transport system ATP-binding protein
VKQLDEPLITLTNAGIYRSDKWLVRDVSLTLGPGEILTLIGPNGSGKSTTAKMALGILKPDEGSAKRRKKLKIRYVPQKVSIDWTVPLKVRRLMSLTGHVTKDEADRAMNLTGTLHLANSEIRRSQEGEFSKSITC